MGDERRFSIRILGSGSPFTSRSRISSCAVVCIDDAPRILIDAGGGAFARVGQAGLELTELDVILLSHTHIDHTGGLAPLIFDMTMRERVRPIAIAGPSGRLQHPGARRFINQLFGEAGAWSYLHTFEKFALDVAEQPSEPALDSYPVTVGTARLAGEGIRIRSLGVPHGMMPALAYRIDLGSQSVTFTGDIASVTPEVVAFARGTSVLVCDMALPERAVKHGYLHLKPSVVGDFAAQCSAGRLVATHIMPELEDELDEAVRHVRESYAGPVDVARDRDVFEVNVNALSA